MHLQRHQEVTKSLFSRTIWKGQPKMVIAQYAKNRDLLGSIPSTMEHAEFRRNLP